MRHGHWIAGLALVMVALAGCAGLSDEERCKKQGGYWKGTYCEMQTR
ncbi:MAG TPA: hypothetical protein VJU81_06365 [Methylomirabilota bacterium]|nr:hypothetical protein [Methylomirabilota bacterium]